MRKAVSLAFTLPQLWHTIAVIFSLRLVTRLILILKVEVRTIKQRLLRSFNMTLNHALPVSLDSRDLRL